MDGTEICYDFDIHKHCRTCGLPIPDISESKYCSEKCHQVKEAGFIGAMGYLMALMAIVISVVVILFVLGLTNGHIEEILNNTAL